MITLESLNKISAVDAYGNFEQCCVSKTWVDKMVDSRPFIDAKELVSKAANIWFEQCSGNDYKEAFTGHPKIGDIASLKEKFAHSKKWASGEQAGMTESSNAIILELAKTNEQYEEKFGYIFIVNASGKTAEEMLAIIKNRLLHAVEDEIDVAMNEQHKITVTRLNKLVLGLSELVNMSSQITTHALDTSIGKPAKNMMITLNCFRNNKWKPISVGITNADGRISDVLPPGRKLNLDTYQMVFNTNDYYINNGQSGFYPEVSIQFKVTDTSHYHIPLLINPFGYSTYRGS